MLRSKAPAQRRTLTGESGSAGAYRDAVIGKREIWLGTHGIWHSAQARAAIGRVGRMAGQSAQLSLAGFETRARRRQQRLMTRVPGGSQVGSTACGCRHTMAASAGIVELIGGELSRIFRMESRRSSTCAAAGPVTGFAPDPEFQRRHRRVGRETEWASRVTAKGAQDGGAGIEGAVAHARVVGMTWSPGEAVRLSIPALAVLDVVGLWVEAAWAVADSPRTPPGGSCGTPPLRRSRMRLRLTAVARSKHAYF